MWNGALSGTTTSNTAQWVGTDHMIDPGIQQTSETIKQPKHDIFVGNLSFSTTEEQLHQSFSELGRIVKVRMVTDVETGRPRGFAFIEFEDPQAALSAIRNMNDYEINGRKIRVNYSNSSHLESLAGKLGMDMPANSQPPNKKICTDDTIKNGAFTSGEEVVSLTGTDAIAEALKSMSMSDMYNIIKELKEIAEQDPDKARKIISGHPQVPEAILHIMSRLEMVRTPVNTNVLDFSSSIQRQPGILSSSPERMAVMNNPPKAFHVGHSALSSRAADPRSALGISTVASTNNISATTAAIPKISTTTGNAVRPADPRARADPRAQVRQQLSLTQLPPPQQQLIAPQLTAMMPSSENVVPPMLAPPPPVPPLLAPPLPPPPTFNITTSQSMSQSAIPPPMGLQNVAQGVASLDPSLIQQVMSLTPAQISQLPVDKQQSILELRNQITNSMQQKG